MIDRYMMPTIIGVSDFIQETKDDYNSPITSTFVSRMQQCRNTITYLEEVNFLTIINTLSLFDFDYFMTDI